MQPGNKTEITDSERSPVGPYSDAPSSLPPANPERRYLIARTLTLVTREEYLADQEWLRLNRSEDADSLSDPDSDGDVTDHTGKVPSDRKGKGRFDKSTKNSPVDTRPTLSSQHLDKRSGTVGFSGRRSEDSTSSAKKRSLQVSKSTHSPKSDLPSLDTKKFVEETTKAEDLTTFPAFDKSTPGPLQRWKAKIWDQ